MCLLVALTLPLVCEISLKPLTPCSALSLAATALFIGVAGALPWMRTFQSLFGLVNFAVSGDSFTIFQPFGTKVMTPMSDLFCQSRSTNFSWLGFNAGVAARVLATDTWS